MMHFNKINSSVCTLTGKKPNYILGRRNKKKKKGTRNLQTGQNSDFLSKNKPRNHGPQPPSVFTRIHPNILVQYVECGNKKSVSFNGWRG